MLYSIVALARCTLDGNQVSDWEVCVCVMGWYQMAIESRKFGWKQVVCLCVCARREGIGRDLLATRPRRGQDKQTGKT